MKITHNFATCMICVCSGVFCAYSHTHLPAIVGNEAGTQVELSAVEYNYKYFEVMAEAAGDYFAQFWLMPAKYADGKYTEFKVYVNDVYAGSITPVRGNW